MAINPSAPLPTPDQLSLRLVKKVEISDPPVSLPKILSIWKNLNVVEEDLDGSGYLLPLGRLGAEIVVNRNDPEERRRFTIAHELGHWVLGLICEKKYGEFQQPPGIPRATVEKWCDKFATTLLMPAPLVSSWLPPRDQPLLIDAILRASDTFGVSEEAFFIRVWELQRIQVATFEQDSGRRSRHSLTIERNYADEKAKKALLDMLTTQRAEEQLQIGGSMIWFALRHPHGLVSVSGRRSVRGRVVLAIAWPQGEDLWPGASA
jgi:Zn-dependent peptidase ImmA (M78 family)